MDESEEYKYKRWKCSQLSQVKWKFTLDFFKVIGILKDERWVVFLHITILVRDGEWPTR